MLNHGAFGGVGDDLNGNVFRGPTKQDHLADEFSTGPGTDYVGKNSHVLLGSLVGVEQAN